MTSLFVISLPRSLSSLVYSVARSALGLAEPAWTTDGEILNLDRFAFYRRIDGDDGSKYDMRHQRPLVFGKLTAFLDQVVAAERFAYKDVVQPFVVSEWLKRRELRVLKLRRPVADVAAAMLARQWHYPARACRRRTSLESSLLQGLIRAREAIDSVPGVSVDYDELTHDERPLATALRTLYPCRADIDVSYIDEAFRRTRDEVERRRDADLHARLQDELASLSKADGLLGSSRPGAV